MKGVKERVGSKVPLINSDERRSFAELDDETIDEAIKILNQQGEETSKENIEQLANSLIEIEEADEGDFKVGFIQDREEATVSDQNLIAPARMEEVSQFQDMGYLERSGDFVRILSITEYPSYVAPGYLTTLYTTHANVRVTQHITPRDIQTVLKRLQKKLNRVGARIARKREKDKRDTQEEEETEQTIQQLIWDIITGKTKLFDVSIYIEVIAEDKRELDNITKNILNVLAGQSMQVSSLEKQMIEAQNALSPAAKDTLKGSRQLMQETSVSTGFPFIEPELVNPEGLLYGFDAGDKPIFFDIYELSSFIEIICGKQGSGKSFAKKWEIYLRYLKNPDYPVWALDPQGDFRSLAEEIGGQIISFGGDTKINPLEIKETAIKHVADPYRDKVRTVLGMYRTHFGDEWNQTLEAVLTRIIRLAYLKYGITVNSETHHKTPPIIQDHANIAREIADKNAPLDFMTLEPGATKNQEEVWNEIATIQRRMSARDAEVARYIFDSLESFHRGGVNANLNGRTNVDFDEPFVVFDMTMFADTNQAPLMMFVLLDLIYQHCSRSKEKDAVVCDEAHYLLNNDDALRFLNLFARHHRHSRTHISLLTQTASEFLVDKGDEDLRSEIYGTADVKRLFHHRNLSEEVIDQHDLTTAEKNYITSARQGEKSDSSQCLMEITGAGKIATTIKVPPYEKHVLDEDLSGWEFLVEDGVIGSEELKRLAEDPRDWNVPVELYEKTGVAKPITGD